MVSIAPDAAPRPLMARAVRIARPQWWHMRCEDACCIGNAIWVRQFRGLALLHSPVKLESAARSPHSGCTETPHRRTSNCFLFVQLRSLLPASSSCRLHGNGHAELRRRRPGLWHQCPLQQHAAAALHPSLLQQRRHRCGHGHHRVL